MAGGSIGRRHLRCVVALLVLLRAALTIGISEKHQLPGNNIINGVSQVKEEWIEEDEEENDADVDPTTRSMSPCRCWKVPGADRHYFETACKCRGKRRVFSVPTNLPEDVNHM